MRLNRLAAAAAALCALLFPALASAVPSASIPTPITAGSGITITRGIVAVQNPAKGIVGPVHNGRYLSDCTISASSQILTSASAPFTSADVGKSFWCLGAGATKSATGWIKLKAQPNNGDTVAINGITITFVTGAPTGAQVQIGANVNATAASLVTYINGNSGSLLVTAVATNSSSQVDLTAASSGTSGNAVALATSAGGLVTGGVDRIGVSYSTLLGGLSTGGTLYGTIGGFTNSSTVTITAANGCGGGGVQACNSVSAVQGFYATDDATAINAALSSGFAFNCDKGFYGVGSTINVPANTSIKCPGSSTTFVALGPVNVFNFNNTGLSGGGNFSTTQENLYVDGGGVATGAFYMGPKFTENTLTNPNVYNVNGFGFEFDGSQNNLLMNPYCRGATTGSNKYCIKFANGAGGNTALRAECSDSIFNNVLEDIEPAEPNWTGGSPNNSGIPLQNKMIGGNCEYGGAPVTIRLASSQEFQILGLEISSATGVVGPTIQADGGCTNAHITDAIFFPSLTGSTTSRFLDSACFGLTLNREVVHSGYTGGSSGSCWLYNKANIDAAPLQNPNIGCLSKAGDTVQTLQSSIAIYNGSDPTTLLGWFHFGTLVLTDNLNPWWRSKSTANMIPLLNGAVSSLSRYGETSVFTGAAGRTVSTTTETSCMAASGTGSQSIPANWAYVGAKFRLTCRGVYTVPSSNTATVTVKVKWGSTVLATQTFTPPGAASNLAFRIDETCTVRSVGASGTIICDGEAAYATAATDAGLAYNDLSNTTVQTIDTTSAQTLDASVTWSSVAGSQTATFNESGIEVLN